MGGLFGKPKEVAASRKPESKITARDRAQLKMKQQRDKLKQYRKKLHAVIEKEKEAAKACIKNKDTKTAAIILRKKKYQEKLLDNTSNQLDNLEQMISQLEFAEVEKNVVDGLEAGNEALVSLQKELDIDRVERVMDDAKELQSWVNELNDVVGTPLDTTTDVADDDLLAEFDSWQAELDDIDQPEATTTAEAIRDQNNAEFEAEVVASQLPDVPDTDPEAEAEQATASKPKKSQKSSSKQPELVPA